MNNTKITILKLKYLNLTYNSREQGITAPLKELDSQDENNT